MNTENKIIDGYTNFSYKKDGNFVQEKIKNGLNHQSDYNELKVFHFVPKLISNTEKESVWEWIEGKNLTNPSDDDLKKIALMIKEIHHSKIKLSPFNLARRIKEYRKHYQNKQVKIPVIDTLYKRINLILRNMDKTTPIHADIWQNNILKTKDNELFLIDWEYAHMGDIHFELAYIIESFRLNEKQEKNLLDTYHDYNSLFLHNNKILVHYLIVLWLYAQEKMPFPPDESIAKLNNWVFNAK